MFVEYFISMIRMFLHSMLSKNYLKRYHMEEHNSSVPRNPNYINLLILNPYLLLSGNDNNRENLKNTDDIFVEKTLRDERLSNKVQTIRSNNLCATSCRKP